ncbi:MAG TPA: hypothetical protein VGU65_06205 [Frateuria sp.]|uniref:hypothetical protein n=1 Tax=Frateuria sp. TaxID=2211372 RepID=UPI002DED3315|nr:hypothetical protein [Frateuria sp.]
MHIASQRPLAAIALAAAAPLVLAIVEVFHPHPHGLFELDVRCAAVRGVTARRG